MLFFQRERGKDVIKQVCGGADELVCVLFHGQIITILQQAGTFMGYGKNRSGDDSLNQGFQLVIPLSLGC